MFFKTPIVFTGHHAVQTSDDSIECLQPEDDAPISVVEDILSEVVVEESKVIATNQNPVKPNPVSTTIKTKQMTGRLNPQRRKKVNTLAELNSLNIQVKSSPSVNPVKPLTVVLDEFFNSDDTCASQKCLLELVATIVETLPGANLESDLFKELTDRILKLTMDAETALGLDDTLYDRLPEAIRKSGMYVKISDIPQSTIIQ